MTTDDKIIDEKVQYNVKREAVKISDYHLQKVINRNIKQGKKN